jgi:hypothetical protein
VDLTSLAEDFALGELLTSDMPDTAMRLLEAGYDSPSLRRLAGSQAHESEPIAKLLTKSLDELGVRVPSPPEAGLAIARRIAGDVVRGSMTPYEGARRIWRDVYTRFPELAQLRSFVGLASEYEDDEMHRDEYSQDIVEECRRLVIQ